MTDLAIQFTGEAPEAKPDAKQQNNSTATTSPTPNQASPQLAQVKQQGPTLVPGSPSPVLEFEHAPVAKSTIQISGKCSVAADDMETVSLDDRLRVCGEFRVMGVRHQVDPKTGDVVRVQVIAPLGELELVPWDPSDPSDNGVVRARP